MRWLITGSAGMLGTDLVALLRERGEDVTATDVVDLDITDPDATGRTVAGHDVVVNTAAWTAVDAAESQEAEATRINADGARLLAAAARTHGARIVQVSTDYVFDGTATTPYDEAADVAPVSAYGRGKAAGERAVREEHPEGSYVVRSAWLYGAHGHCFPRTIARVATERGGVDVVTDQVGQPTWTVDLADVVHALVTTGAPAGIYHATSGGQCSWFEFAQAVVVAVGLESSVVSPTTSDALERPAPRPSYSVLGHAALQRVGIPPIADWASRWAVAAPTVLGAAAG